MPTSSSEATRPSSITRPAVGSVIRLRILSSVDFPAPLRPMMPKHLAALDLEGDILERPQELLHAVALDDLPPRAISTALRR